MFSFEMIGEETVNRVFAEGNVLAKTVRTVVDDDRNWEYLLKQIASPKNNRPVKPLANGVERSRRYNYFLQSWESAVILHARGSAKDSIYTKKMSTTLLPTDGCVNLFTHGNYISVGILFDLTKCHLKQNKYIFNQRVNTDERFWLRRVTQPESQQIVPANLSLDILKASLALARVKNQIPEMNELLVGFSRAAVIGVFARNNNLFERLVAYRHRAHIKALLNKSVPVFILSSQRPYQSLSEEAIRKDIQFSLILSRNNPNYNLARIYIEQFPNALVKNNCNASYSYIMKYLTLEEQRQLSLTTTKKNANLDNIISYAKSTLNSRLHQEDLNFKNLISELFSVNRSSLDTRLIKDLHKDYQERLFDKLREFLADNNAATDVIFKQIAYHLSRIDISKSMRCTLDSIHHNKAVLPKTEILLRLNTNYFLASEQIFIRLLLHADQALLLSLNVVSIFNKSKLYNDYIDIKICTDVARRSGEEMHYEKQTKLILKISLLTIALLYQKEKLAYKLLRNVPEVIFQNTLQELRMLRNFIPKYYSNKYEWNSNLEKRISLEEVDAAYAKILKTIYYHKMNIPLDKYEKRLLEGLLINVIKSMPTPQRLSELMSKLWVHPITNQQRHPFFDRLLGKKETQIKTNLREAGAKALSKMKFSI